MYHWYSGLDMHVDLKNDWPMTNLKFKEVNEIIPSNRLPIASSATLPNFFPVSAYRDHEHIHPASLSSIGHEGYPAFTSHGDSDCLYGS